MGVDIGEPGLDVGDAMRIGRGFRFGQQGRPFKVAASTKSITEV